MVRLSGDEMFYFQKNIHHSFFHFHFNPFLLQGISFHFFLSFLTALCGCWLISKIKQNKRFIVLYSHYQAVCVTRFDQSECVICRVISALEKSRFQRYMCEIFALFQACVGNFDTTPPWKVVGTLYLDSSFVTFKYLLSWAFVTSLNCSVMCRPPWWFECCFCRSSWTHC